jgi:ATP-dependent Clp protease ATP-binding subunit ClpC
MMQHVGVREAESACMHVPALPDQVLEDGRLTDSQGRVVSFKHALLVLTSNVGSAVIAKGGGRGLGFALPDQAGEEAAAAYGRVRELVLEELKVRARLGPARVC